MPDTATDRIYMQRCIDLAGKGLGKTAPNPMVGCVIVAGGRIIGEGYHRIFGGPHAEANAISSVKDKKLLERASLYVNLEPCSHHGKTPPCSALIRTHSIPEVIIGCKDPHQLVSGKGISELKKYGVKVTFGIMEKESLELNRRFITFHERRRPYIILKWAQTLDGFMDRIRNSGESHGINWITGKQARQWVHKWRSEEGAILVGTNTAAVDDPELTVRDWHGKNPLRLVIDMKGRLSPRLKLFDGSTPTIVFTMEPKRPDRNLKYIKVPSEKENLKFILGYLYSIDVQSIIVEGGARILNSFIESDIWDEARVFSAELNFGKGMKAPLLNRDPSQKISVDSGFLSIHRNLQT
jgi:diaminohydroxyphosphoribosylaminopyrimidine deaminase/5-amino-6-(5-phosphoribosylamino)uracil reductase